MVSMRLRAISVSVLLVLFAAFTVRETRCGSECQAAAALFAANARSVQQAEAAMPGMEDCPMAKSRVAGDGISVVNACTLRMTHAPEAAQAEEHFRAPEFSFASVDNAGAAWRLQNSSAIEAAAFDVSPPGRPSAVVSLQTTRRI